GLTFVSGGNVSASMAFTGTLTDLNAALDGLKYTSNPTFIGPETLAVSLNDLGNTGLGGALTVLANVTIDVIGPNQKPTITAPASISATEDTAFTFSGA